jgi:hypothetical protein
VRRRGSGWKKTGGKLRPNGRNAWRVRQRSKFVWLNMSRNNNRRRRDGWPDETYEPGTEQELERWRQCGPLGRAHNICVHSRGSPQRIQEFKGLSGGRLIRRDNDTRWNSWFTMLESMLAPSVRSAISQYVPQFTLTRSMRIVFSRPTGKTSRI